MPYVGRSKYSMSSAHSFVRQTQFRRAIECGIAAVRTNAILSGGDVPIFGTIMDRIDAMKVFIAALDEGSLARAGRKLGRSPAAVILFLGLPRGEHKVRIEAVDPEGRPFIARTVAFTVPGPASSSR
jgi:hypothetical protein